MSCSDPGGAWRTLTTRLERDAAVHFRSLEAAGYNMMQLFRDDFRLREGEPLCGCVCVHVCACGGSGVNADVELQHVAWCTWDVPRGITGWRSVLPFLKF